MTFTGNEETLSLIQTEAVTNTKHDLSSKNNIAILTIISGTISESLRDPGFSIP